MSSWTGCTSTSDANAWNRCTNMSFETALGQPFPIDRRALTACEALGLSEARIRGALRTLEAMGFLVRAPIEVRRYKRTSAGWQRRPVLWTFAPTFAELFAQANKRATAARDRQVRAGATQTPRRDQHQPQALGVAMNKQWSPSKSPIRKSEAEKKVLMGEKRSPSPAV